MKKLEDTKDYIESQIKKGYYTKKETNVLLDAQNAETKDFSNAVATGVKVELKATEAGEKAGRTDLTYMFKNVAIEIEKDVVIEIEFPANNTADVTTTDGLVALNKFAYSLKTNAENIIVEKSEVGSTTLKITVYKKTKDGKKGAMIGNPVLLTKFDKFKDNGYKGFIEIPAGNDFDNANYAWASEAILDAMATGKIDASATFRPNDSITRAEFAKILMNSMSGVKADAKDEKITKSFNDVDKNEWYYEFVMPLAELGIVSGFDGEFRPEDKITREEAAVMVATALNRDAKGNYNKVDKYDSNTGTHIDDVTDFNDDKEISTWADNAVKVASEAGVIKGFEGKFRPADSITRAESIVMLQRADTATIK